MDNSSPSAVLFAQAEHLRTLRDGANEASMALVEELRAALANSTAREADLQARLSASERHYAAATNESQQLSEQVKQLRASIASSSRRSAWELRKQEEAAAGAAAAAASKAAAAEERVKAELARQGTLLRQRERELRAAHAQIRTLRHKASEELIVDRQAAWLQEHEEQHTVAIMHGDEAAGRGRAIYERTPDMVADDSCAGGYYHQPSSGAPAPARETDLLSVQEGFITALQAQVA